MTEENADSSKRVPVTRRGFATPAFEKKKEGGVG
jgi:hypothetical protein